MRTMFKVECDDVLCEIVCCNTLLVIERKDIEPMLHNIIKTYIADQLSAAEILKMSAEEMKRLFRIVYNEVMRQIREKNYAEF
ncbi:hypothetical protein STSV1pORF53 [Sulfolobus virus STSV1]|uniref:hypothetical protein n=1 Tax=Sulfolobus virus STSV1 TaxID=285013 RepID=UPI000042B123|nr:hypothetical protein STSV1pORF53 [Sulfolobus virus STSV1]CAH04236.1 hypothetical protein [Sulfolobus virus STSV1]